MPGPGPHMMYTFGSGQALMHVSVGRFGPHHCVTYAINAFFGPDIGSFSEWLTSTLGLGRLFGSSVETWIHDPFYYVLILGLPLSFLYSWVSRFVIRKGILDSFSGVPLTARQCFLLIFAGSLSHFFLDHLFEENGHSSMYTWILSTGWWENRAPVNSDAVFVIGLLCTCLVGGFIYIYRGVTVIVQNMAFPIKTAKLEGGGIVKPQKPQRKSYQKSLLLIMVVAVLYCLWCASQIYLVSPRRPAVGEEADLGVLVFLGIYFFIPHWLCILSMNPKEFIDATAQLPL